jgi:ABC-type Na+ transport system ATPase subunit NatA
LILGWNSINNEGAIALADALKVNSSLTSLNLGWNSFELKGAIAIPDALQMNTTLQSLYLNYNSIDQEGAISFAKALTHNPTLLILDCEYEFHGLDEFKDTFHNLQGLLNILIGKEGAQVLSITFQIKSRCLKLERRKITLEDYFQHEKNGSSSSKVQHPFKGMLEEC